MAPFLYRYLVEGGLKGEILRERKEPNFGQNSLGLEMSGICRPLNIKWQNSKATCNLFFYD